MKRELHAPVIEIGTPICANIQEVRHELTRLRGEVIGLARHHGLRSPPPERTRSRTGATSRSRRAARTTIA